MYFCNKGSYNLLPAVKILGCFSVRNTYEYIVYEGYI